MTDKKTDWTKGAEFPLMNKKVLWANIMEGNPDTKYGAAWKLDAVLTDDEAKSMEAAGFGVKADKKTGEKTLTIKTKCIKKDGTKNRYPTVVGRDGKTPFTEEVGNGSICNIKVWAKQNVVKGETFLNAYINAVQVVEHVARGAGFDDVREDNEKGSFDAV